MDKQISIYFETVLSKFQCLLLMNEKGKMQLIAVKTKVCKVFDDIIDLLIEKLSVNGVSLSA